MGRTSIVLAVGLLLGLALASPAAAAPAYDELPDDRVLYIAPGQSLSMLVRRLYPDRPGEWAGIRQWIVDNNRHAFVDGDPARMRADVRVKLPHASALARRQDAGGSADGLRFGGRYLFVDPAQSLEELVPALYPGARGRWNEIVEAIIARNADVLAAADAGATIGRGTRITIPELSTEEAGADPGSTPTVGEIAAAVGRVVARSADGRTRTLRRGDAVRRDDTLETGPGARAEIRFDDGERVFLRPASELRIRDWRLPDVGPGTRVLELVAGGLRAVTGAIGNRDADDYRTITPYATMGVRGTRYALRVCGDGACRMGDADAGAAALAPGVYVGVDGGRVAVLNGGGELELGAGEYGYVAGPAVAPARADADVARVLYTTGEREDLAAGGDADTDDGPSWWWIAGGLLLLALAL